MEKKHLFTPSRWILLVLALLGLAGQGYLWQLQGQGLRFLWDVSYILCPLLAVLCGLALLYQWARDRMQKRWLRTLASVLLSLAMLATLTFSGFAWMFSQVFGGGTQEIHVSPDGKRRLVTMDTGFMDAVLRAYPMVGEWTYHDQENGYLSYHELGAIPRVEINWRDGEALVRLPHGDLRSNEGSNPAGYIRVTFEE